MDRLGRDKRLYQYAERILSGERIKFYPRQHRRQAELELLDVIKADAHGCCSVRNRIYLQAPGMPGAVTKPGRGVSMGSFDQTSSSVAVPQELVEQLGKGNAVLFVGAGLSIGAGLPGWGALVRPLAERIGYTGDDLLKAAQFYENRRAGTN